MPSFEYNQAKADFHRGAEDWDTSTTYKAMLLNSSYTPNKAHTTVAQLIAGSAELSGTGYTGGFGGSGRKTLANPTVTQDDTGGEVQLDADDLSWPSINAGTIRYVAIIRETGGSDANSKPIFLFDSDKITTLPLVTNGGTIGITWNAEGLWKMGDV